jgi:hypothetical protein
VGEIPITDVKVNKPGDENYQHELFDLGDVIIPNHIIQRFEHFMQVA